MARRELFQLAIGRNHFIWGNQGPVRDQFKPRITYFITLATIYESVTFNLEHEIFYNTNINLGKVNCSIELIS